MVVGRIQTYLTMSMCSILGCAAIPGLLEKECCASESASYSLTWGTPAESRCPSKGLEREKA